MTRKIRTEFNFISTDGEDNFPPSDVNQEYLSLSNMVSGHIVSHMKLPNCLYDKHLDNLTTDLAELDLDGLKEMNNIKKQQEKEVLNELDKESLADTTIISNLESEVKQSEATSEQNA